MYNITNEPYMYNDTSFMYVIPAPRCREVVTPFFQQETHFPHIASCSINILLLVLVLVVTSWHKDRQSLPITT